jgi:uncharacterized surface protein with fasciclin (FAS1) repeats
MSTSAAPQAAMMAKQFGAGCSAVPTDPSNPGSFDAFAKIPKADLDKVLADNATLTKILTFHVVPGQLSPEQLAGTHKTLQGGTVTVTGSGTDFMVGNAKVVCGHVSTANATVYIIDTVLMPSS